MYVKQKHLTLLISKAGYLDHTANLFECLNVLLLYYSMKCKTPIFMYKVYYKMPSLTIFKLLLTINHIISIGSFTF